jgi:DNA-cytosine methyltransferase
MYNFNKGLTVVSLFDGCSMLMVALKKLGFQIDSYFASEVDKYAESVSRINWPSINRMGDVKNIIRGSLPINPDLLVAGFPCQSFSVSGKKLYFDDERGKLFFEALKQLKELNPKYFIFENVKMKKEIAQEITKEIKKIRPEVKLIELCASDFSAQRRTRYFWTNLDCLPYERSTEVLNNILDNDAISNLEKSYCIDANYHKGISLKGFLTKHRRTQVFTDFSLFENPKFSKDGLKQLGKLNIKGNESIKRFYDCEGKSSTVTTGQSGNSENKVYVNKHDFVRKLNCKEVERLMGLPDNYTAYGQRLDSEMVEISNTQRYKMSGNGFSVPTISHLLKDLLIKQIKQGQREGQQLEFDLAV